ncbi:regulator of G-protein signaling loco isoform X1 [Teleopsis dalmanni]|uniref:regulator of G-protein signaling loco isoform X1 n=1 Tax=Teleopsis dalmanni TaxID=139649 RepID=UPI0018CD2687|nr:regulator of G-protein signaling loco isoform X1 [Teleopsis dalmanni]
MHHHHHSTSIVSNSLSEGGIAHQRRRKKRPNYGTRTVEVRRGYNGFGFTISGQQPCRLSCIVQHSPADQAGLRAGDFLISVNGLGVSKLPHETVVQLIGNSFGSIRMQIAENYFSDSSDEENAFLLQRKQFNSTLSSTSGQSGISGINGKPRFLYHRNKVHRLRNSPNKQTVKHHLQSERPHLRNSSKRRSELQTLRPLIEDLPLTLQLNSTSKTEKKASEIKIDGAQQISSDVANVSAMVRIPHAALEYRVIVGYLGTIEMPKQISNNSKLQTVRSCIRKLRQEKRQPSTVLMTILPDCLRLQSSNGTVLASYASERLNYVSSSSESENRFFGLVTSSIHTSQADEEDNDDTESRDFSAAVSPKTKNISISNSCHVFVIDTKLCSHQYHKLYADQFHIQCTEDPISNLCLEFPNNSEYVVNLIRSMYTMRILPAATYKQHDIPVPNMNYAGASHSPQPSNISEVSTTTSNSDSGIGFYNDVKSISDRILVVDFPKRVEFRMCNTAARPSGIFNNFDVIVDKRLTVRAMPDPVTDVAQQMLPELSSNFNLMNTSLSNLQITRSCDDVLSMVERTQNKEDLFPHTSLNNISLNSLATPPVNDTIFLHPSCVEHISVHKKPINESTNVFQKNADITNVQSSLQTNTSLSYKLSPQVFVSNTKRNSKSDKSSLNLEINDYSNTLVTSSEICENYLCKWNSLQNLETTLRIQNRDFLGATNSEPNLGENCDLDVGASPLRCAWSHSSFRTPRTDKHLKNQSPLVRRTASMTASDNDVSIRSVTDSNKEFYQKQLQHRIPVNDNQNAQLTTNKIVISNPKLSQAKKEIMEELVTSGAAAWGNSFERMLEDPFGLHTFAEFLKKEFSAENIYFWTACERYRQLENKTERSVQALSIFNKHLGDGAIEPVNVDSHARNLSEEKLKCAEIDIFIPAQKQIFNLMKFDSYQRFIRSDLYKSCLEAEQKKQPLPYGMEDFDELLQTHFHQNSLSKLKKSVSNAEDRRRKSLLPWHRKMRSKSRDREAENKATTCKVPQIAANSLKIPSVFQSNSTSDIHSSRSSLSSFDALPSVHIVNQVDSHSTESITCSLCRVILSDGATTIVQIRPEDTVKQLVERLLEKRGLIYKFYDVVINGSAKSIDLQNSATVIAGKEVFIEQRVAFKLDLPDPKVISVKSKPKKQLQEVVRPILLKYNYSIDNVHVVFRDTHEMVDLSLPVTIVDGQRLQIIQIDKPNTSKYSKQCLLKSAPFPIKVEQLSFISEEKSNIYCENTGQSTLDEITNKVFSELLQGKVEAHASNKRLSIPPNDVCSLKSDDYVSESSSLFNRAREKNNQGLNLKNKLFCNQNSEENITSFKSTCLTDGTSPTIEIKKPIIAKLKAGVKVQVTERMVENQDELLEGLKRAQLARLEDQRGTEINFELPDFLKNKENMNEAASNLRKVRANLSPISKQITLHESLSSLKELPQPAPRFSITNKKSTSNSTKNSDLQSLQQIQPDELSIPVEADIVLGGKSPPPLPPKPKVLPTKPSNWGVSSVIGTHTSSSSLSLSTKIPLTDHSRKTQISNERCYIEETSSSFV